MSSATYSTNPSPPIKNSPFSLTWTDSYIFLLPSNYDLKLDGGVYGQIIVQAPGNTTNTLIFNNILATQEASYTVSVETAVGGPDAYSKTALNNLFVTCFLKGTEILTSNSYVIIENLKIGDEIQTYKNGLKKIKYISKRYYKNDKTISQICKISNLPNQTKDLFVTGGHSILVDELNEKEKKETLKHFTNFNKIDDKYLLLACIGEFEKLDDNNEYEIYHIILENEDENKQYGIYANGVLTESMSEKCYLSLLKQLKIK